MKTPFDIARAHLALPIGKDVHALKQALHQWVQYNERVSLQEKPTYAAQLQVVIRRPLTASTSTTSSNNHHNNNASSTMTQKIAASCSSLWERCRGQQSSSGFLSNYARLGREQQKNKKKNNNDNNNKSASGKEGEDVTYHLYETVVPLELWTAVLPWEVQRGLSLSRLALPSLPPVLESEEAQKEKATPTKAGTTTTTTAAGVKEEEEEEDPYGVVSPPLGATLTTTREKKEKHSTLTTSATAVAPGMLFLMPNTPGSSLSFWSGAITAPIDLYYVTPMRPAAVERHPSFQQLLRERRQLLAADNYMDPEVMGRYFPKLELVETSDHTSFDNKKKTATSEEEEEGWLDEGNVEWPLIKYSHLDPFVYCDEALLNTFYRQHKKGEKEGEKEKIIRAGSIEAKRLQFEIEAEDDQTHAFGLQDRCYETEGPDTTNITATNNNSADRTEAPLEGRYIIETVRHLLKDAVAEALQASRLAAAAVAASTSTAPAVGGVVTAASDEEAEVELRLRWSPALRHNLVQKAQLSVHYVADLEQMVQYHLKVLNTPYYKDTNNTGSEEMPTQDDAAFGGSGGHAAHHSKSNKKIQFWISETESLWMTREEMAQYQRDQVKKSKQTPMQAMQAEEKAEAEAAAAAAAEAQEEEDDYLRSEVVDEEEERQETGADMNNRIQKHQDGAGDVAPLHHNHHNHNNRNNSVNMTAGTSSRHRSIAHESPALVDEDEGRPQHLTPSFIGSHPSPALKGTDPSSSSSAASSSSSVVSAAALARYIPTRPDQPLLPPIDYELFELCLRLGVAMDHIVYYYYERLLREWRAELKRCITLQKLQQQQQQEQQQDETVVTAAAAEELEVPTIEVADLQRMVQLVRDPTLQVPEELTALVEAVAVRRGEVA